MINFKRNVGAVAKFSCNNEFQLRGSSRRTCMENGHWSNESPACVRGKSQNWRKKIGGGGGSFCNPSCHNSRNIKLS